MEGRSQKMRFVTVAIRLIIIAPGILIIPFTFGAPILVILGLLDPTSKSNLILVTFVVALSASIFAGVVASVSVILSGTNHIRMNKSQKTKAQTGLALGIVGGCSAMIWLAKFIMHEGYARPWGVIESWVLFFGPSIALMTYQFVALTRPVHSNQEATVLQASKNE
jgi:hypothetical protein